MSLFQYSEEEENYKEESIDKYRNLFNEFEKKSPNLSEALYQMFISYGADKGKADDLTKDIYEKCKSTIDKGFDEIKKKYDKINKDDAYIICSYTCEAKDEKYSPYKILNQNLVSKDRQKGIRNIYKYLYIFIKSLRKLTIYKPKQYLYRCIKNQVSSNKDPNNEKWVPYQVNNIKTFWGFTSTSPNIKTSFQFLKGEKLKYGTIFSLIGDIWGYDITLFNYYKEEEILLEPERTYKIKSSYLINDIMNITCEILKTPLVLDNNFYTDQIYNYIEEDKIKEKKEENLIKVNKCIAKIEMEIYDNDNYRYISGLGILCNIPSKNMKVLITYNNIINNDFLSHEKKLILYIQNEKKEINMEISRYKNTLKDLNITVIEILNRDNLKNFIEIDDFINSKDYNEEDILYIKFNKNNNIELINDKIIQIDNNLSLISINQLNEGIILLNNNLKIIGIIDNDELIRMNILINGINYIKSTFQIKKEDIGKETQILNNGIYQKNVFFKTNDEIEDRFTVIINKDIKRNIFKYKFNKEDVYVIYYLFDDILKNASNLFTYCTSLISVNLSSFNSNNLTKIYAMFYGCSSLKEINLSSFNTDKVDSMELLFYGCSSLTYINLSSFNTKNVTLFSQMFANCSSLKEVNLSSFDTNTLYDMRLMFYNCASLTNVNLSSFNFDNVTNMQLVFYGCSSLEEVNLSSLNTINITDMCGMFANCSSLKKVDLSSFKNQSIVNMSEMFEGCSSLKEIDLSSYKNNFTKTTKMFDKIPKSCNLKCKEEVILKEFKKSTGKCLIF